LGHEPFEQMLWSPGPETNLDYHVCDATVALTKRSLSPSPSSSSSKMSSRWSPDDDGDGQGDDDNGFVEAVVVTTLTITIHIGRPSRRQRKHHRHRCHNCRRPRFLPTFMGDDGDSVAAPSRPSLLSPSSSSSRRVIDAKERLLSRRDCPTVPLCAVVVRHRLGPHATTKKNNTTTPSMHCTGGRLHLALARTSCGLGPTASN
jgi:hypothetical protein